MDVREQADGLLLRTDGQGFAAGAGGRGEAGGERPVSRNGRSLANPPPPWTGSAVARESAVNFAIRSFQRIRGQPDKSCARVIQVLNQEDASGHGNAAEKERHHGGG